MLTITHKYLSSHETRKHRHIFARVAAFCQRVFQTSPNLDVHPGVAVYHTLKIFSIVNAKYLLMPHTKFQVCTLKINIIFCHRKKKSHYFWTGVYKGPFFTFKSHIKSHGSSACVLACHFPLGASKGALYCLIRILETAGSIWRIWEPYESPLVLDAHWLSHFTLGVTGWLKKAHGAQIVSGIRYVSANMGLIFTLVIYEGRIVILKSRSIFTPSWHVILQIDHQGAVSI